MNDTFVVVELDPPIEIAISEVETVVVVEEPVETIIVEVGEGGAAVDPTMFFQVLLYLSELDNQTKKTTARTNLGFTTSASAPSGGQDGDIWIQYTP